MLKGVLLSVLGLLLAQTLGCGANLAVPAGGSQQIPPGAPLAGGGASFVYLVSAIESSVLRFPAVSSVNPTPALLEGPGPEGYSSTGVAIDSAGSVYISSQQELGTAMTGRIDVYPPTFGVLTAPLRTITGTAANPLTAPRGMCFDKAGQLYVLMGSSTLRVYAPGANGPSDPVKTLTNPTPYTAWYGLAVDSKTNVYVTQLLLGDQTGSVLEFDPSATGNATPIRTITSKSGHFFYGVAVDADLNVYVSADVQGGGGAGYLAEYSANASGVDDPLRTISGNNTGIDYAGCLRLDAANNLWALNANVVADSFSVVAFNPQATGNVGPGVLVTTKSRGFSGQIAVSQ